MKKKELIERWGNPAFVTNETPDLVSTLNANSIVGPKDFRGITLGLTGSPKDLEWASFVNKTLTSVDFSFARLSCSFDKSVMECVNFTNALLDTSSMCHVRARHCDFSGGSIDAPNWNDAHFDHCAFHKSKIKGRGMLSYGGCRAVFNDCDFSECKIRGLEFRASKFINGVFNQTVFERCDLRGAKFEGSIPQPNQFKECNTQGIHFNGQPLDSLKPE